MGIDEHSGIVNNEVRVQIDKLTIYGGRNLINPINNCTFTLHRGKCDKLPIEANETIAWNTRICFQWYCNIDEHAIRVESCWVGSKYNPVYLINSNGCSAEAAMISTPRYDHKMQKALSLGWLTVRKVGYAYLRLKCNIQLCHVCDEQCTLITVKSVFFFFRFFGI
uniref:ZP domain-containing protein n=1 Tax=Setaria digitata TaxID=48799 RepID=A0A915Q6A6_9BILA